MDKFPKTLRAVQAESSSLWEIADALVVEVASDRSGLAHDGELKRCAKWLKSHGFDKKAETLGQMRAIAKAFPKRSRKTGVAFFTHGEALKESPEGVTAVAFLKAVIRVSDDVPTKASIRAYRKALNEIAEAKRAEHEAKAKAKAELARAEADVAVETAVESGTKANAKKAETAIATAEEAEKAVSEPPKPSEGPEDPSADLVEVARLGVEAHQCANDARAAARKFSRIASELSRLAEEHDNVELDLEALQRDVRIATDSWQNAGSEISITTLEALNV